MTQAKAKALLEELNRLYPDAKAELHFTGPFQTLIATMLSAQCTDKRVNLVTEKLFATIKGPDDILKLTQEELEGKIKSCGLYHTKAKNIRATCALLNERHGGAVPGQLAELVQLPGVGRKTANVVYANAFGGDAIAVDTHVLRVSNRLGMAKAKGPEGTERQLQKTIPKEAWSVVHHQLIYHGRRVCHARKPDCEACTLSTLCAYAKAQAKTKSATKKEQ